METSGMGRLTVAVEIANWDDIQAAEDGTLGNQPIRHLQVSEALVDTGAAYLALHCRFIRDLGLRPTRQRRAKTLTGLVHAQIYEPVQLTVEGRECWPEVSEAEDACPVLIGQFPLESLDRLANPQGRRLIGNPEHAGKHMFELY